MIWHLYGRYRLYRRSRACKCHQRGGGMVKAHEQIGWQHVRTSHKGQLYAPPTPPLPGVIVFA